jgi:REP element-mobilizing transposase RayT
LFGKIRNGKIALSECGRIVDDWWQRMPERYSGVILDEFVIMPNHMHAIIVVTDDAICRGEVASPLGESVDGITKPGVGITKPGEVTSPLRGTGKHTLGQILAFYKYQTTKSINAIYNSPGNKIWQRNYYEHVIRNKKSLYKIREYIRNNPLYWAADDENPERGKI